MELTKDNSLQKIALSIKNLRRLAPDVFDMKNNLHPIVTAQIKKMIVLIKKESLSFIKAPLDDVVLFGDICTPFVRPKTDIDIGLLLETCLPEQTIENINLSLIRRGFDFKIAYHCVKFHVLIKGKIVGANYSIIKNKWNVAPIIKDLDFASNTFFKAYADLAHDFNQMLSTAERNNDGFLTLKGREIITQYLLSLEEKEKKSDIYTLDYRLIKALYLFGIRQNLNHEIALAECSDLNSQIFNETKEKKPFNLEKDLERLLCLQPKLDPRIFNENGIMKEDIRQSLLKITDKVYKKTITDINGLEIKDICLTGSSSNYFWRDDSDIDLRIEVINKSNKSLEKDIFHFDKFLGAQMEGLSEKGYAFYFQNRTVDIKMSLKQIDFISIYSIKDNVWRIEPNRDAVCGISKTEMIDYYKMRKAQILEEFYQIKTKYKGVEQAEKLEILYLKIIDESMNVRQNIKKHIFFKLLNQERLLKAIGSESILAYNKALSLI